MRYRFGRFVLDVDRCRLECAGTELKLRPQSFLVLRYLVENSGRLVTKSELMGAIWGKAAVTEDSLVQCLGDIRKALQDHDQRIVQTKSRQGYVFKASPQTVISSIAVLPFLDLSDTAQDGAWLGDGLAEELISVLGRVPGLKVASRSSSFRFRGKALDLHDTGRQLNVEAVLEGSVRRAGNQLRVSVRLVDPARGYSLWSKTFERRMDDVLAIQEEIARSIAGQLQLHLREPSDRLQTRRHSQATEAYCLYLTGRYFWNKRTREGFERAIDAWQQALQIDPNYALAHAGIADAYSLLGYFGYLHPQDAYRRSGEAARRAIEIDDTLAEAHTSLGDVALHCGWQLGRCEHELATAVALEPGYSRVHHLFSHYWIAVGDIDRSLAASRQALDIDPTDLPLIAHLGWHYYHAGDPGSAIASCQKALDMDPFFTMARIYLGQAYTLSRRYAAAIEAFEMSLAAGSTDVKGYLGLTLALAGLRREAEEMLADLLSEAGERYVSSYHMGTINLALGDVDQAFVWLGKEIDEGSRHAAYLKLDPMLAPLRLDRRFALLLSRIPLPS
jgi:TolB-like protein/Tfp pilus assembly protein PilF